VIAERAHALRGPPVAAPRRLAGTIEKTCDARRPRSSLASARYGLLPASGGPSDEGPVDAHDDARKSVQIFRNRFAKVEGSSRLRFSPCCGNTARPCPRRLGGARCPPNATRAEEALCKDAGSQVGGMSGRLGLATSSTPAMSCGAGQPRSAPTQSLL
jgi:hypothetical protein